MLRDEEIKEERRPVAMKRRPIMRQRRFIIGAIVVLGAMAFLMFSAFQGAASYYLTVNELKERVPEIYGESLRLNGSVVPGSVQWDAQERILTFDVTDKDVTDEIDSIPVVYQGTVPDIFEEDIEVVAEGRYTEAGIFEANNLLVKCPSKYEPAS